MSECEVKVETQEYLCEYILCGYRTEIWIRDTDRSWTCIRPLGHAGAHWKYGISSACQPLSGIGKSDDTSK
jgi:hypothetical protein